MEATFWRRAAAVLVDVAIIGAGGYLLENAILQAWLGTFTGFDSYGDTLALLMVAVALAILWLYPALFECGESGATPGKRLLGLRARRADGAALGFGRASARALAKLLSTAILGIGFLMALGTKRKQALHDLIAGTIVVRA